MALRPWIAAGGGETTCKRARKQLLHTRAHHMHTLQSVKSHQAHCAHALRGATQLQLLERVRALVYMPLRAHQPFHPSCWPHMLVALCRSVDCGCAQSVGLRMRWASPPATARLQALISRAPTHHSNLSLVVNSPPTLPSPVAAVLHLPTITGRALLQGRSVRACVRWWALTHAPAVCNPSAAAVSSSACLLHRTRANQCTSAETCSATSRWRHSRPARMHAPLSTLCNLSAL